MNSAGNLKFAPQGRKHQRDRTEHRGGSGGGIPLPCVVLCPSKPSLSSLPSPSLPAHSLPFPSRPFPSPPSLPPWFRTRFPNEPHFITHTHSVLCLLLHFTFQVRIFIFSMRVRVSSLNAQAHLSSLLETSVEARLTALRGESADASKAEESAAYLDALRQRLADMQTCILASLERSLATQAENTAEGMSGGQNDDERNGSAASGALPQEWELADEDLQAMPAIQPALGELAQIEVRLSSFSFPRQANTPYASRVHQHHRY